LERRFLKKGVKRGVGAENEMGWRGKFRDSLGSKCGPGKKDTPKVSGDGPCSLNIRSNPPCPAPIPYAWSVDGFAGLRKTALLVCGGRGVFLQGAEEGLFTAFLMPR